MKAVKLTKDQKEKLVIARRQATAVLNEVKLRPLEGKDLTRMRQIEAAVVYLENALLI